MNTYVAVASAGVLALSLSSVAAAQDVGTVLDHAKVLPDPDAWGSIRAFGRSVTGIGDVDGDGITELAVGAHADDIGEWVAGAVFIQFMNADGTVRSETVITTATGGDVGPIQESDFFGGAVAPLGDLDDDGVPDLAVGATATFSMGYARILFLDPDGTVKAHQTIGKDEGGLTGFPTGGWFGISVAAPGDLDGDGVEDLIVGARGAQTLYVLFLAPTGWVTSQATISLGGAEDSFGEAVAPLGDVDGDGVIDLAVGMGEDPGAIWVLRLHPDGTLKASQEIGDGVGGFRGALEPNDRFGQSVAGLGDVDGDGVPDVAVGSRNGFPSQRGAVWILFLKPDGTVKGHQKIDEEAGGFTGILDDFDYFGDAVGPLGDLDQDGRLDLAVGALGDDDAASYAGSVWLLFLETSKVAVWTMLEGALAGSLGVPVLSGDGSFLPGTDVFLHLQQANPLSTSFLVIGPSILYAPFKGGVMVPQVSVIFPMAVDGDGEWSFGGPVGAGVHPGSTFYFQSWIVDAAGPAGFSSSNGLAVTTP